MDVADDLVVAVERDSNQAGLADEWHHDVLAHTFKPGCAELDWHSPRMIGADPSTDVVARLDHDDVSAVPGQFSCRTQTSHASADDEHARSSEPTAGLVEQLCGRATRTQGTGDSR